MCYHRNIQVVEWETIGLALGEAYKERRLK